MLPLHIVQENVIVQELKYEAELVRVAPELDGDSVVQRYVSYHTIASYTLQCTCIHRDAHV